MIAAAAAGIADGKGRVSGGAGAADCAVPMGVANAGILVGEGEDAPGGAEVGGGG